MNVIDEYLGALPASQKKELQRIRSLIKHAVPDATEQISYGMPAFRYKGRYLVAYAAFKNHLSIFPGSDPVGNLKEKLHENITGKGTIQFTLEKPLDDEIIVEIVQLSMARIDSK